MGMVRINFGEGLSLEAISSPPSDSQQLEKCLPWHLLAELGHAVQHPLEKAVLQIMLGNLPSVLHGFLLQLALCEGLQSFQ